MVMACVTIRKRKLYHWCGQDTGAYGPTTCIYRKILQFPAVAVATVGRIISHYQNHLKVILRHSQESGTDLLYRTVNGQPTHTYTNTYTNKCVQCDKQTIWMYTDSPPVNTELKEYKSLLTFGMIIQHFYILSNKYKEWAVLKKSTCFMTSSEGKWDHNIWCVGGMGCNNHCN